MTVSARLSVFSDPIKDFPLTLGSFLPGLHWSLLCCPLQESPLQGSPDYLQHLSPPWGFVLWALAPLASRNLCPQLSKVHWAGFQFAPGASLGNFLCNKLEPLFPISQGSLPGFTWCQVSWKSLFNVPSLTLLFQQLISKTQQWPQDWKRSVFIPIPKNGNVKECSNYCTIALISHASKVMLKILQARIQAIREPWTSWCSSWFQKKQRNQRSNCQHPLNHGKSKRHTRKRSECDFWVKKDSLKKKSSILALKGIIDTETY